MRITAGIIVFLFASLAGCAEMEKQQMSQAAQSMSQTIADGVAKGIEGGMRDVMMQAGAQAINPNYTANVDVFVGTAVKVTAKIGLEGVSGQMQMSAASGRDVVEPPSE